MPTKVVFAPPAATDLTDLYDYIAERAGPERALAYIGRIEAACRKLGDTPQQGTQRNDIRPGLRTTGFERRLTIAFHTAADRLVIDRLLYAGRQFGPADTADDNSWFLASDGTDWTT